MISFKKNGIARGLAKYGHRANDARERCFACGKPLGANPKLIDTRDGQTAYVGSECWKFVAAAGDSGYQPPRGGPKLYPMSRENTQGSMLGPEVCPACGSGDLMYSHKDGMTKKDHYQCRDCHKTFASDELKRGPLFHAKGVDCPCGYEFSGAYREVKCPHCGKLNPSPKPIDDVVENAASDFPDFQSHLREAKQYLGDLYMEGQKIAKSDAADYVYGNLSNKLTHEQKEAVIKEAMKGWSSPR